MAALSVPAKPTLALVYNDETLLHRNRTRQKLTERGFAIKKEYQANSRRFDFSTVDLVVAIADGLHASVIDRISSAGNEAGVEVLIVPHQMTRPGWERLDAYLAPSGAPALHVVRPAEESGDTDAAEIFAILESERDEARALVQRLTGDLGNVRADRERLSKESADLRGKVLKLEASLEEAKLGSGEVQAQRSAWTDKLTALEAELAAAREQNRRLKGERDAALEKRDRDEATAAQLQSLREETERIRKERADYVDKYRMAAAREAQANDRCAALRAKLDAEKTNVPARVKSLSDELAKTARQLVDAQAEVARLKRERAEQPSVPTRNLAEVASALRAVVRAGVMTEAEAFQKLADAAQ